MITFRLILISGIFSSLFTGCDKSNTKYNQKILVGIGIVDWISLNHDGSLITMGNAKGINGILLFDTAANEKHIIWDSKTWGSDAFAQGAAYHPTNSAYIACSDVESAGLVNWQNKEILFRIKLHNGYSPGIEFSLDGTKIYVVHSFFDESNLPPNWDRSSNAAPVVSKILIIDIDAKAITDSIAIASNIATDVCFSKDRNLVSIRYMGGECEIWNLKERCKIQSVRHYRGEHCVLFVDDKSFLTDGDPIKEKKSPEDMDNVILWNLTSGSRIRSFNPHKTALESMGIILGKDGEKLILSGSNDRFAKLWDISTGKIVWSQKYGYSTRVATSGNGCLGVISADSDPIIIDFEVLVQKL